MQHCNFILGADLDPDDYSHIDDFWNGFMQQIIVFDEAKYDSNFTPNNTSFYDYTQTTTLNYEIKCYGKYEWKKIIKVGYDYEQYHLN